jgi:hypothetical protein
MGFLDWLTGNSVAKRNNVKIARIKKELNLMTRDQRIARLRKMKKGGYYPSESALAIEDIYDYGMEMTSDFILYYLLYMNEDIRGEVEMGESVEEVMTEEVMTEEVSTDQVAEEVLVSSEQVAEEAAVNIESVSSDEVVESSVSYENTTSESSDSVVSSDDVDRSSYNTDSYDSGSSYDSCDSGGDCGGCD